jgi:hypothetical protein
MLFQTEKAALKPSRLIANAYDAMLLSGAVIGFGSALLFAGSLDKVSKAMLTTMGMAGLAGHSVICKVSEKVRKVDNALEKVQWDSMKYQLKEEEEVYQLAAEVSGATRKVELIINKSNPWEWSHWARRVGVEANMPPLQDLTAEQVEQPVATSPNASTDFVTFEQEVPDLVRALAEDMKNTLIVGVPGSGKGLFVSNALGHVQARGDTTIFYVDPKNDLKETGYFKGRVNYCYRLPKGVVRSSAEEVWAWLEQCLEDYEAFDAKGQRKLLVIDELTACMKKLNSIGKKAVDWLEEKISTYAASGDSEGITIWGIGQNAHNTGTGMDGGTKSQLTPIAIISIKQLPASQSLQKADFIPSDKKLNSDDIKGICQQSEIGRAIFHGGLNQWFPMPVLPNPSGYDRDSRKQIEVEPQDKEVETVVLNKPVKPLSQIEEEMMEWMQSLDELPSPEQVKAQWEELSGKTLTASQLSAVLKGLGLG